MPNPTNTVEAAFKRAIVNGDIEELRLLMSQVSELSSSDAAIARRALTAMEKIGGQRARAIAGRYGVDWANEVTHALTSARDGPIKQALLERYGSPEAAFVRVDEVLRPVRGLPEGNSQLEVVVDGLKVILRIFVKQGTARISTIQKW